MIQGRCYKMNSLNFEKQNIIPEGAYQEAFTAPLEKMIESKLSKLLDAIHKVYVQQIMSVNQNLMIL